MHEAEKDNTLLGQKVNDVCILLGIYACRKRQLPKKQRHSILKVKYNQVVARGVGKDCVSFEEQ